MSENDIIKDVPEIVKNFKSNQWFKLSNAEFVVFPGRTGVRDGIDNQGKVVWKNIDDVNKSVTIMIQVGSKKVMLTALDIFQLFKKVYTEPDLMKVLDFWAEQQYKNEIEKLDIPLPKWEGFSTLNGKKGK